MLRRFAPLTIALLLGMFACTNKTNQNSDSSKIPQPSQPTPEQSGATTSQPPPSPPVQAPAPPNAATSPAPGANHQVPPPRVLEHGTQTAKSSATDVGAAQKQAVQPVVIPAGTEITIRIAQTLDATKNKAGDRFDGTVAKAVVSGGKTLIPASSPVTGTVVEATRAGKVKGEGRLSVRLTDIRIQGVPYAVKTATLSRAVTGKGKRSAVMIGGGTGAGALIGGIAGGGKGAAIGAIVGGGAGTAGATLTGNEQISFPAESALTFRLQQPVTLSGHSTAQPDQTAEHTPGN